MSWGHGSRQGRSGGTRIHLPHCEDSFLRADLHTIASAFCRVRFLIRYPKPAALSVHIRPVLVKGLSVRSSTQLPELASFKMK